MPLLSKSLEGHAGDEILVSEMSSEPRLAERLLHLNSQAFDEARSLPFLIAAGKDHLHPDRLAAWFPQNRLYGLMGYAKFLAGLSANCLSHDVGPEHSLA